MRALEWGISLYTSDDLRSQTCTRRTYHALSPRGLMPKPSMSPSSCESWRRSPPSGFISHTCIEPLRSERKRIVRPSALQAGELFSEQRSVSSLTSPLAMSRT